MDQARPRDLIERKFLLKSSTLIVGQRRIEDRGIQVAHRLSGPQAGASPVARRSAISIAGAGAGRRSRCDCCFGGAFARGLVVRVDQVESGRALEVPDLEKTGRGQAVITAADVTQFAFERGTLDGQPLDRISPVCFQRGWKLATPTLTMTVI